MGWGRQSTLAVLFSTAAVAASHTVTIAAGDCKNADLAAAAGVFSATVSARSPDVLTGEAVLERFRPAPTVSAEDLGRQLDAAQTQFYSGSNDKALETLRQALAGIERLSVRADPWKLLSRGLLMQALVFKALGKKTEANEAQKRVLRIEPQLKLDADYYTPSMIQGFEALRKETQKAKKARLTITSQPTGSEVFVDGALLGKTPFSGELLPGDYRVSLANGEALSFTREVHVARDEALQIDLAFEGTLSPRLPLCVNTTGPQLIDTALKLAALAGADSAVVLRSESRNNEPGWVTATLLEVNKGSKLREAGIRFTGPKRNEALADLAGFVLTGKTGGAVVATIPAPAAPAKSDAPISEPPKTTPTVAAAPAVVAEPAATAEVSTRGKGGRIASFVLMVAGAGAAATGAAIYAGGGGDRASLDALIDSQGRLKTGSNLTLAKELQAKVDTNGALTVGLLSSGGAVMAIGAAVFFLFPPESAPQLSVVPLKDGAWVGTRFSF